MNGPSIWMCKVLHVGLWWSTLFTYATKYDQKCDLCKCLGWLLASDEIPLQPFMTYESF